MTEFELHVQEPWFSLIYFGHKTIEGRLAKNKFLNMQPNDTILFKNNDLGCKRSFSKRIRKLTKYKSFKDFLTKEDIQTILPTINDIEIGISIYRKYYSEQQEKTFGILGIHF